MGKNREEKTGIRMEIHEMGDDAVAVDALVDDLLHNNFDGALHDLHVPYTEGSHYNEKAGKQTPEHS